MSVPSAAGRHVLVHLVRHADAGERERFEGDDGLRPLTREGRRQAEALAERIDARDAPLLSSPALRCLETLAPMSSRSRRAIEPRSELAEGEPPGAALKLLLERAEADGAVIACSHGDVVNGVVELALEAGARLEHAVNLDKAATAELSVRSGKVVSVAFVPAPTG